MLILSKKNLRVFIVLALLLAMAGLAVIHAVNPVLGHQLLTQSPNIQSGYH